MSAFEWTLIGLVLFGVAIPLWLALVGVVIAVRRPERYEKRRNLPDYIKLLESLRTLGSASDGAIENDPALFAVISEMKNYPEFRESSLQTIELITIKGEGKMAGALRDELKSTAAFLQGLEK